MDRFVTVHCLHVRRQHVAQGIGSRGTVAFPIGHCGSLPRGPVDRTHAAALDDVEQAADLTFVDLLQPQAFGGQGQQLAKHELDDADLTDLRPVDIRGDPVSYAGREVLTRRGE